MPFSIKTIINPLLYKLDSFPLISSMRAPLPCRKYMCLVEKVFSAGEQMGKWLGEAMTPLYKEDKGTPLSRDSLT